jgi:diguanylate cyclase (GGDEF)-like protein
MADVEMAGFRLRLFLLVTRLAGLAIAMAVTRVHSVQFIALPPSLVRLGLLFAAAVVLYELIAGAVGLKANKPVAALLAMIDGCVGLLMGFQYGPGYMLLGLGLPVITLAVFFGTTAAAIVGAIGSIVFGLVMTLESYKMISGADLTDQLTRAAGATNIELTGVQLVFCLLLGYLATAAVHETKQRLLLHEDTQDEIESMRQSLKSKAQEVGQVYAEVGQRQTMVSQLEQRVAQLERELEELENQLVNAVEDQDHARHNAERLEKATSETETRMKTEIRRQKSIFEREQFAVQKKLERETRLLVFYRMLTSSLSLSDCLLALTGQLQALLASQSCVIFLIDEVDGQKELFPEVAATPYIENLRNRVFQLGEEAPGLCVSTGKVIKIDDGSVQVGEAQVSTLISDERSALVAPLLFEERPLGAIYLGRVETSEFTPDEQDLLTRMAELAGMALANSLEYQRRVTQGMHDPVTRLYNNFYLEERLKEEVMRSRRYTYPMSLILVDLDGFDKVSKEINEETLHLVLAGVADIIRTATRETDVPARIEDDHFGILCVHTDRDKARVIAERIRVGVESRNLGPAQANVRLTASVGLVGVPHDGTSEDMLRKRAQEALALAKSRGGNRVCFRDEPENASS